MVIIYDNNYLAHHGILGQRWGVRRFQNEDGSLTAAGRKRYGLGDVIRDRKVLFDVKKYANKDGSLNDAGKERFGTKEKYTQYKAEQHAKRVEAGKYAAKTVAKMVITAAAIRVGREIFKGIKDVQPANADPTFTTLNSSGNSNTIFPGIATKPSKPESNRPISSKKPRIKTVYWSKIGDDGNTYYYSSPVDPTIYYNSLHYGQPKSPYHTVTKIGDAGQKAMINIMNNRRHRHYNK